MNISVFEVSGPIMVGPSSSHTAGAVRLGRIARCIVQAPFTHVAFGLHGSFAKTYKGHGTDKALLAGILGLREDDEKITCAFDLADRQGLCYSFYETALEGVHENSVEIVFSLENGGEYRIIGSSIGGGQVLVSRINGFDFSFSAQYPTLLINQYDRKGIVSHVTGVLAENGLNIGTLKLSRKAKGEDACCVIEVDGEIPQSAVEKISKLPNVLSVQAIQLDLA